MRISDWSSDVALPIYLDEHLLFVLGVALDRVDQVRHQIGAALVLVEHFRPGCLDRLVLFLDGVVTTAAEAEGQQQQHKVAQKFHGMSARKSVVSGKSVSVRVDPGGRRFIKEKNTK